MSDNLLERHLATYDGFVKVHLPFDGPLDMPFGKLTVLSKVEGLTVLSEVEGLMALSKVEGLTVLSKAEGPYYTSSFIIATQCKYGPFLKMRKPCM